MGAFSARIKAQSPLRKSTIYGANGFFIPENFGAQPDAFQCQSHLAASFNSTPVNTRTAFKPVIRQQVKTARNRGKSISCAANLKQFGSGVTSYTDSNRDFYCFSYIEYYTAAQTRLTWYMMLAPYMGIGPIQGQFLKWQLQSETPWYNPLFVCPMTNVTDNVYEGGWWTSYQANATYSEAQGSGVRRSFFGSPSLAMSGKATRVRRPSQILGISDGGLKKGDGRTAVYMCVSWMSAAEKISRSNKAMFPSRHGKDTDNILFLDGHVAANNWQFPIKRKGPLFGQDAFL